MFIKHMTSYYLYIDKNNGTDHNKFAKNRKNWSTRPWCILIFIYKYVFTFIIKIVKQNIDK